MLRVNGAKGGGYRETPIPPNLATRIRTGVTCVTHHSISRLSSRLVVTIETYSRLNSLGIYMGRTSIPVDESTKDRLDKLKQDGETWDEFLHRITGEDEPIRKGDLSEDALDEIEKNIERSRESF